MKTEFSVQSHQALSAGGWGLGTRLDLPVLSASPQSVKLPHARRERVVLQCSHTIFVRSRKFNHNHFDVASYLEEQ